MRLSEVLRDDLVALGLEAVDKWEAIEELVDHLISAHEIRMSDRHEVIESLFARERSLSTGLKLGVAIPHASVGCVDGIVAAVGTSMNGIPFESLDGKPARLIILLLIPSGSLQRHLRTLAGIAKLAACSDHLKQILASSTPAELIRLLYAFEQQECLQIDLR